MRASLIYIQIRENPTDGQTQTTNPSNYTKHSK